MPGVTWNVVTTFSNGGAPGPMSGAPGREPVRGYGPTGLDQKCQQAQLWGSSASAAREKTLAAYG